MSFLVDTDIVSAYVRSVNPVQSRFLQYTGGVYVSTVTMAEVKMWLLRANTPTRFLQEFSALVPQVYPLDVDDAVALKTGEVGAFLLDRGITVATPDLLIAATALLRGLTLVTHNTQDYVNVPGLTVADWLVP